MGLGTLLIRADASSEIGTGHVMRTLALAQVWQERGGQVTFCMAHCTAAIHDRLTLEKCEIVQVPSGAAGAVETVRTAGRRKSDHIVLDGYAFDAEYQAYVYERLSKVLYIDDLQQCQAPGAHIVLNPNLTATEGRYPSRVQTPRLLLGTRYCLLRREFRCWGQWTRKIPAPPVKILVTLGGSTPEDLAACILRALAPLEDAIGEVVFVFGYSSGETASLHAAAKELGRKIIFQKAAADMATLMARADVAIAAAGSTCWELCYLGLPALLVDVAENQTTEALALQRGGYADYLSRAKALDPQRLSEAMTDLVLSENRRHALSIRSRTLVDGHGAERVISAMLNSSAESEQAVAVEEVRR